MTNMTYDKNFKIKENQNQIYQQHRLNVQE